MAWNKNNCSGNKSLVSCELLSDSMFVFSLFNTVFFICVINVVINMGSVHPLMQGRKK